MPLSFRSHPICLLCEMCIFAFVCISFPVYVAFIVTLVKEWKNPALGAPFFKMAIVTGLCDLLFVMHHYIFWKAPHFNLFPQLVKFGGVPLGRYGFFIIFFSRMGQAAGVFLMTINRLIVILKPMSHDRIITIGRTIVAIIVIQVLVPTVYSTTSLWCSFVIVAVSNGTEARYMMDESCFGPIVNGIAFTFLGTGILVLVGYGIILAKLINSHNQVAGHRQGQHIQRNITIIAALISGLLVFNCLLMFKLCPPEEDHHNPTCAVIRNGTEMLFSMCNPYVFYVMSAPVREKFVVHCYFVRRLIRGQRTGSTSGHTIHHEQNEENIELRPMKSTP